MWNLIDEILTGFRSCFSRNATYTWFVVIVLGLMIRSDHLGVSSIIRDLNLKHNVYEPMVHFFRSSAWRREDIHDRWCSIVLKKAPLLKEDEAIILIGDGVKQAKEARYMPGVKRQHQESENSSKAEFIFGHLFGGIGILAGSVQKQFCLPLSLILHDGIKTIFGWSDNPTRQESHIVQIIEQAYEASKHFGKSILLLDRYFLSSSALLRLQEKNDQGALLQIVTKAKSNCVAYQPAPESTGKRGRPRKKGAAIKLRSLFETAKDQFVETAVLLYGKEEAVKYYCVDLLWGQKRYQKLRFVLVLYHDTSCILVSTDLELDPVAIIRLYSYRFKVECTFRELKQVIGGFAYRFWSKSMPKLNRFRKKDTPDPLSTVVDSKDRERITATVKAIEGYVMLSCIAIGILQMLSLRYPNRDWFTQIRYLRTPSKQNLSEASIADCLRKGIFHTLPKTRHLLITQIIISKQKDPEDINLLDAS